MIKKLTAMALALFVPFLAIQSAEPEAILQGIVDIEPLPQSSHYHAEKIKPGASVKLSATIENKGNKASPEGQIFLRYAFANPLDKEPDSILFKTEMKPLPAIEPLVSIKIDFKDIHQWPSLSDYICHDWGMREYQAVVVINGQEKVIGTLAVTFSAYYYPGMRKELPAVF